MVCSGEILRLLAYIICLPYNDSFKNIVYDYHYYITKYYNMKCNFYTIYIMSFLHNAELRMVISANKKLFGYERNVEYYY